MTAATSSPTPLSGTSRSRWPGTILDASGRARRCPAVARGCAVNPDQAFGDSGVTTHRGLGVDDATTGPLR
jgi:hypothetical protein